MPFQISPGDFYFKREISTGFLCFLSVAFYHAYFTKAANCTTTFLTPLGVTDYQHIDIIVTQP